VPVVRRPRATRSFLVALAAALTVPVLAVPGVGQAEAPPPRGDTVVGELVQVFQEYEDEATAVERADGALLSFVRPQSGDSVRLDTDDVEDLPVGATVEVTIGGAVTDEAADEEGLEKAREVLAAEVVSPAPTAPAFASPQHEVTVVMVTPAGGVQDGTTLQEVVEAVDGPVADFWWEQAKDSFGVVDAQDWITTTADCSDPFVLWKEVADRVGFVAGPTAHLLLYVTSAPAGLDCAYGLGTVGPTVGGGGYAYVRDTATSVIAHELGHNLGLRHSSALQCDQTIETGTCETVPYADYYDVMGYSWSQLGSLSMAQASRLNHLPAWDMREIHPSSPSETVTLAPVSDLSGMRGILLWGGPGKSYWLEFRAARGRDSWIGAGPGAGLDAGVQLRRLAGTVHDHSLLLDGSPSGEANWAGDIRTALPLNSPLRLAGGDFTVTVKAVSTSSATVQVTTPAVVTPIAAAHAAAGGDTGVLGAPTSAETCSSPGSAQRCWRLYEHGVIHWSAASGAHAVHSAFYAPWIASGGTDRWGLPTSDTVCGLAGGGCSQDFTSGSGYWSPGTGLFGASGAIRNLYRANGAQAGTLGYPTAEQVCGSTGCRQTFQGGTVVSGAVAGTRVLLPHIAAVWAAQGYESGPLAYPVTSLICGLKDGGCGQVFQGGRIYTAPGAGAHAVSGAVHTAWVAQNYELGALGYATGDLVCGLPGGGCKQAFQGGSIWSHPIAGTHPVSGPIAGTWATGGGEGGALGYPTSGLICGLKNGGCGQVFQSGIVYTTSGTGTHALTGAVKDAWVAQGFENGPLGYPTSGLTCGLAGGACKQTFQGGTLYSHPTAGTRAVTSAIATAWSAAGGEGGPLGHPTSGLICGLKDGGCGQVFSGGIVYTTARTGTHALTGEVKDTWVAQGFENGPLGYPTSDLICGLANGGCGQVFQGGRIFAGPGTGAHALTGAVQSAWIAQGWEAGPLGYPTGGQVCGVAGGCSQAFQGGTLYSHPTAGTRVVSGTFATTYAAAGGPAGTLGYPTSGLVCGLKDSGCGMVFQGGKIYESPGNGVHALTGRIHAAWVAQNYELGSLGYPTGDQVCGLAGSGCKQSFQGGTLWFAPGTAAQPVTGAVLTAWTAAGGEVGPIGYPTSGLICGLKDGGCGQVFQGGRIYDSPGSGAHAVTGAIHATWVAQRWELGPLGYATADQVCGLAGGGCKQEFQGGTVWSHPTAGAHAVSGGVAAAYATAGSEGGALGYPVTGLICGLKQTGCGQVFQGGRIYTTPGTGAHAVSGPIHTAWVAQGWEIGPLGYAVSDAYAVPGGMAQDFQGGKLTWDTGTGTVTRS
jgi:uncharacterized protein with LGFP repeats